MTNINPDNLIKGEPYLIEAEKNEMIITALGIYKGHGYNTLGRPKEILTLYFYGALSETTEVDPFFFLEKDIDTLTHLKRGEVIK